MRNDAQCTMPNGSNRRTTAALSISIGRLPTCSFIRSGSSTESLAFLHWIASSTGSPPLVPPAFSSGNDVPEGAEKVLVKARAPAGLDSKAVRPKEHAPYEAGSRSLKHRSIIRFMTPRRPVRMRCSPPPGAAVLRNRAAKALGKSDTCVTLVRGFRLTAVPVALAPLGLGIRSADQTVVSVFRFQTLRSQGSSVHGFAYRREAARRISAIRIRQWLSWLLAWAPGRHSTA